MALGLYTLKDKGRSGEGKVLDGGPAGCMSCKFRTPHSEDEKGEAQDSCENRKVMSDPANDSLKLPDGTVQVDNDDWCRLFEKE